MDLRVAAWSSTSKIVLPMRSGAGSPVRGRAPIAEFAEISIAGTSIAGCAIAGCAIAGCMIEASTAGRNISIQVPLPASLSTWIVPPDSLTMRCTVAKPRPVPSPGLLVVKKGSNSRARVSAFIPQPLSCTTNETARRALPGFTLVRLLPGNLPERSPRTSMPGNSPVRVLNVILPPSGIASRAFSTRFNRICRNCAGSASTRPAPESSMIDNSIGSPINRRSRFSVEATISLIRTGLGSAACFRAMANS